MVQEKTLDKKKFETEDNQGNLSFLILHNDDFHTFDYVIENLVEICNVDTIQAEQCAWIVHTKGKCDIKKGNKTELLPLQNKLKSKGLIVSID